MTAVSASVLKGYFQETDAPTCAQFSDLIDSLFARGSAAGTAQGIGGLGGGAAGTEIFQAATTASARNHLGISSAAAVGQTLYDAATTASAQTNIGGGVAGRTMFEAITTASAQSVIGGGAAGRQIFEAITTASALQHIPVGNAATTAQMTGPTNTSSVFITPGLFSYHPLAIKGWVDFRGVGGVSVRDSWNVGAVARIAEGHFRITWGSAFPSKAYAITGISKTTDADTGSFISIPTSANTKLAADVQIKCVGVSADISPLRDTSVMSIWAISR